MWRMLCKKVSQLSPTKLRCTPHTFWLWTYSDLFLRGIKYILVIGDYFTKWKVSGHGSFYYCKLNNFESILMRASGHIKDKNSIPPTIWWDCRNRTLSEFAYRRRSDGTVETVHFLNLLTEGNEHNWDAQMPTSVLAHGTSVHETTGIT